MARKQCGEDSGDNDDTNPNPDQDIASCVSRLHAFHRLRRLYLLELDLSFLQPVLPVLGQYKSSIGDIADPAAELGAMHEAYFDWAVWRNATDLPLDR
jgi:hypothetical protein